MPWGELSATDKDPRTCVPNAKGRNGSRMEQRDEMAAWRAKTSVAPCIVMAMKADGTLADRGAEVPAAERMWPLVTLGMARCRSSKNAAPLDPATTGERAIKCRRAYVMKGYTEWSALGDEDKDPRTCVPNAKGPDGTKSEQRDEMAAWRAKTSVAPCIVMAMKADGTLADRGAEVPAAERMWPLVTLDMARCRDFKDYNKARKERLSPAETVVVENSRTKAQKNTVLTDEMEEAVATRLVNEAGEDAKRRRTNPLEATVREAVLTELHSVPENIRTKAQTKAIEKGTIGAKIVKRLNKAVRTKQGTWTGRPNRKKKAVLQVPSSGPVPPVPPEPIPPT
jgi:hypothetical protein